MKLVLIVPAFPKLSETFIISKFRGLLEHGYDAHIVCAESSPAEWAHFPDLKRGALRARVHSAPATVSRWKAAVRLPFVLAGTFLRAPAATLSYLRRSRAAGGAGVLRALYLDAPLIRLQPDVVHFEFGTLAAERPGLRERLGCRVGVSFRGYDLNFVGLETPGYYDSVWQEADRLHLLGEDLWRRAQGRGCPPDKPHALIPPAIDTAYFTPPAPAGTPVELGTPERPIRLLSVGRLEWKKGYEFALEAVRLLRERGLTVEYTIIGGGAYLEALAFCRHQLDLESCVTFRGPQPREAVRAAMAHADIMLHAAVSEGFCNAVIEAQAMALPVVTSDADGLGENVLDGVTGFVIPRRDAGALADRVARLAADPVLRQQMGQAGRARALAAFDLREQAEQFAAFYRAFTPPAGGTAA